MSRDAFYQKLNDPGFFMENRIKAHSDHKVKDGLRLSLNGKWKFHYASNTDSTPEGFENTDYDDSGWELINVPGHIQLQGYDVPQYVNTQYPWDGRQELDSGQAPEEFNPVASYSTRFTMPPSFPGKRIFLSFQGVESCFRLWVNGEYTGFSSDTFTPSEFEITDLVKEGENKLSVQVFKWYCGSWLEDQDFFRFSGIFRDVYLYAVPEHHVMDIKIDADYDPRHPEMGWIRGEFTCMAGDAQIEAVLFAPDEEQVGIKTVSVMPEGYGRVEFDVPDPQLWSAEQPGLYCLRLMVRNAGGEIEETIFQKVGIRHFQMDGNIMKLNGKRLVIKGVNRHEFSADGGRTVTREELVKDLYTMKRHNINAIRLCHYPNSSAIYELADDLGFYLIDECNMETHGTWDMFERGLKPAQYVLPGDHMEYLDMLLDRLHSMYQRDKNHPSILIWSLGNESFGGPVIHAMSRELKRLDSSRLIHYEGIFHDRRFPDTSDIESQMYTPVRMIREFLEKHRDKPFICCEYMHAMGNSCGALYKYTDLTEEDPLYQGGFIWDYIDQAIRRADRYGRTYMAYGGDHAERPNDGNFSGNGLVDADRNPTPKIAEVKYCYQNISVKFQDPEQEIPQGFTVINRHLFTGTGEYQCVAALERGGIPVTEAQIETDVPPGAEQYYPLPFAIPEEPGEYALTVSFRLKENTPWAEKGFETAFGQHVFRIKELTSGLRPGLTRRLELIPGSYNIGIRGTDFEVLFSRLYGGLTSYRIHGREMLAGMVKPNFWRAPIDNDNGNMLPFRCAQWKTASLYPDHKNPADIAAFFRLENPAVQEEESGIRVTYTYYLPTTPAHSCRLSYLVCPDGTIETTLLYEPPAEGELPDFPEFSVLFKMDADYDRMEWYGLGPQDCYPDRKRGAKLGIYHTDAQASAAKYLVPQESGWHEDVRWMKVTDENGSGLEFDCGCLGISVSPWSPHEIESALHPVELPPVHYTYIRVGQQMGVGGDDSWGSRTHEEFLLPGTEPRAITFRFRGIKEVKEITI